MQEKVSGGPVQPPAQASGPAFDGENQADRKAIETLLNDYFSKQHDRNLKEYLKAKVTTVMLRWVVGLTGLALSAAPIVKVIVTEETDRQILGQADGLVFLLPGLLLMVISLVGGLWSRGWPAPMFLAIAIAAFDVFYFETGPAWLIPLMIFIAALAFVAALVSYFYQRRQAPKSLADLEKEIDELTAVQFREFVRDARAHLPIPADRLDGNNTHYLRCFPKRDRLNVGDIVARIGTDAIPRVSPIGVCAFDLGENDVAVLEGAVDLKTGEAVYLTVHQFAYQDVSAVIWSSDVWPKSHATRSDDVPKVSKSEAGQETGEARNANKPPVLRLEQFKILLKSTHAVEILFHDGALAGRLEDKDFERIEETDRIRAIWDALARKRSAAAH